MFPTSGKLSAAIVPGATPISCPGFPNGLPVAHAERINADLLAFS